MKQRIIFLLSTLLFTNMLFAQFSISGNSEPVYDYKNQVGSGTTLDHIFVLKNLNGAVLVFESESNNIQFYTYSNSQSNKTLIPDSEINKTYFGGKVRYEISNIEGDRGYISEFGAQSENNRSIWIIDYSKHIETLNTLNLKPDESTSCTYADLILERTSQPIIYYDDVGAREVKREYAISYKNIVWDSKQEEYVDKEEIHTFDYSEPFRVNAPLINTVFEISGDQFAKHFNIAQSAFSGEYEAKKIEIHLNHKIVEEGGTTAGDSASVENLYHAPVKINFYSNANREVAQSYHWKIYHNTDSSNPDNYIVSYVDEDISYTFTQAGEYTVKLTVGGAGGICDDDDEYTFRVSESLLEFPNFLSPGTTSEGLSNIFRASYRSIVRFRCTIFNRWGNKIYEWTDPAGGWDGTYKGKTVSPGVYFYVVDAEGSDGQKFKKGADINVLHGSNNTLQ